MLNDSLYSSSKQDWETPATLFDPLNEEFGFTLDCCASPDNAKVKSYYSTRGLERPWRGVVWMNPPYGRDIKDWVAKARREAKKGAVVVALLPVRSDTRWWHQYVMKAEEVRLLTRRLSFVGASNKATFPAAIVVFGQGDGPPILGTQVV